MSVWVYLSLFSLLLAYLSVWSTYSCAGQPLWLWLLGATVVCAFPAQLLTPLALLWLMIAIALFYGLRAQPAVAPWLMPILAIYLFALALQLLPGFSRVELIAPAILGQGETPYGLRFGLAKPLAGLLVFGWLAPRCISLRQLAGVLLRWQFWLLPAVLVMSAAWLLGVAFDPKWLWWTPLFVTCNGFLTVIPEEAFFRSFLQQPLQNRFGNVWWIIPLVAALFACSHVLPLTLDVWRYFAVIFIAGLAYAWSFQHSGKVESAAATHLAVNLLHLVFFVYPLAF